MLIEAMALPVVAVAVVEGAAATVCDDGGNETIDDESGITETTVGGSGTTGTTVKG